jgi:hypothetical protein
VPSRTVPEAAESVQADRFGAELAAAEFFCDTLLTGGYNQVQLQCGHETRDPKPEARTMAGTVTENFRSNTIHDAVASTLQRIETLCRPTPAARRHAEIVCGSPAAELEALRKEILLEIESTNDFVLAVGGAESDDEIQELLRRKSY